MSCLEERLGRREWQGLCRFLGRRVAGLELCAAFTGVGEAPMHEIAGAVRGGFRQSYGELVEPGRALGTAERLQLKEMVLSRRYLSRMLVLRAPDRLLPRPDDASVPPMAHGRSDARHRSIRDHDRRDSTISVGRGLAPVPNAQPGGADSP